MNKCDDLNLLKLYMNDIHKYDLLSNEEEQALGKKLLLRDKIKIFKNSSFKTLDLPKLLLSINNIEEANYIIKTLRKVHGKANEISLSCNDNLLKQLDLYEEAFIKKGIIPNKRILENTLNTNYQDIEKITDCSLKEQVDLYATYMDAKTRIANANLRLVTKFALNNKRIYKSLNILDLITYGNIGLLKAIDKYDVTFGIKFSTYASHWILQYIDRGITQGDPIIHISDPSYHKKLKYEKIKDSYEDDKLSYEELAKITNYSIQTLKEFDSIPDTISYDLLIKTHSNHHDDPKLAEILTDENALDPSDILARKLRHEELEKAMNKILKPRERFVLTKYFGLEDDNAETLQSIGKQLNIKHQRVAQIRDEAKAKIKRYDQKHGNYLRDSLNDYN